MSFIFIFILLRKCAQNLVTNIYNPRGSNPVQEIKEGLTSVLFQFKQGMGQGQEEKGLRNYQYSLCAWLKPGSP